MNKYEMVLFIWLTLLTIGFSFILFDMLDRTKKLKDTLTKLYSYVNDDVDPQIKRVRQLVNVLLNDKKDKDYNDEADKKIGQWIKEESIGGWDGHSYQCSVCGRSIHLDTEVEDLEDYPYCHCGAKMQEAES